MRARTRVLRVAVLVAAAMVGLVGAHALDYLLLFRNPAVRTGFLRSTGHAYFGRAIEFALVSALLAVIGSIAFGFARARGANGPRWSLRATAVLALIQSGGFVALEAGERVAARAPAHQLVKVTLLGVLLQAIVATGTALLLSLLERAGEAIALALGRVPPPAEPSLVAVWPGHVFSPRIRAASRASPRAPPFAFAS